MENRNHSSKVITAVTYVYMILPFLIFAIGWMKIYFWIPAVAAVLFCAWKAWRDTPAFWRPQFNKDNIVKIIFILAIISAGLHSIRLEYVELFNRFFEGGGVDFNPLKIIRKHTIATEE